MPIYLETDKLLLKLFKFVFKVFTLAPVSASFAYRSAFFSAAILAAASSLAWAFAAKASCLA